ncbi:PepSY domain-containing protein [Massilia sp. MB5]|uniref:PepSY-associated TM helix domain-containing protein n=1 Tax=Massilia sp. MB5 TaxID=2919578 RepID=UPI001F1106FB|nr:PepSY-associated TM helix domain-containing protein [Massilia sp. MB5]UMR31836.1 PepSY domain-containing protein [Massilia sp. MB5]
MKAAANEIQGGLRQRMSWLHTWGGLWVCWLAFIIFLPGTLSVFSGPITHWMEPEHPPEKEVPAFVTPSSHATALEHGQRYLREHAPNSSLWEMWPRAGEDSMMVYWLDEKNRFADARLSTATGLPVTEAEHAEVRETAGGGHFIHFHYRLHAGTAGVWIVGAASIAMLVALISGVITHKRIFKDFFTFRPAKGQRSWLDAHNLMGVLTLPFLFIIVFSGVAISWDTLVPAVRWAQVVRTGEAAQVRDFGPQGEATGQKGELTALPPLVQQAEATLQSHTFAVVVNHPGDAGMKVQVYGMANPDIQQKHLLSARGMLEFDGVSGALLKTKLAHAVDQHPARATMQALDDMHRLHFAGTTIRWLYFVSGLAGTALMATGAILFMVKRRQKSLREFGDSTQRFYRICEVLNLAAIGGLVLACIGYLWGNRLLPVKLHERHDWEIAVFFSVWLVALLHALLRPSAQGWREQLLLGGAMCVTLPLLNWITAGQHLVGYWLNGDLERGSVELVTVLFGVGLLYAARKVGSRIAAASAKAQAKASAILQTERAGA